MNGASFKGWVVGVGIIVAVLAVGFVGWKLYSTGKKIVTEDLNPASDKNIAYSGVNSLGAVLSGDSSFSLGSWIYDVTHPSASKPGAAPGWWDVTR